MKLYTIKFANGSYFSRTRKDFKVSMGSLTEDINEAYIYHDTEYLVESIEGYKDLFPRVYQALMEEGGGSYKLIEVKITEVEDETDN